MTYYVHNRADLDYDKRKQFRKKRRDNKLKHQKARRTKNTTQAKDIKNRERFFEKTHLIKPSVPTPTTNTNNKLSFEIDVSIFLLLIETLLKEKKITKAQLETILGNIKETEDKTAFEVQDPAHPERVFKLSKNAGKGEIRDYWLYLMKQNNLFCDICGYPITTVHGRMGLTYDHIQPRSKGGKTDAKNGSPAHQICNGLKTNILPETWEKVGAAILQEHGIQINPANTLYKYAMLRQR